MVTGNCADIGKFKVPSMRGLAARAPYFHNGAADTLMDLVNFYDQRFNMLLLRAKSRSGDFHEHAIGIVWVVCIGHSCPTSLLRVGVLRLCSSAIRTDVPIYFHP